MKTKNLVLAFVAILAILVLAVNSTTVLADSWQEPNEPDVEEMTVYINGEVIWHGYCVVEETVDPWACYTNQYNVPALERDSQLSIKVVFKSKKDLSNVKIHAWLNGYRESIEARTNSFDVFRGNLYSKTLFLRIPNDIDAKDTYTLYVKVESKHELTGVDEAKIDTSIERIANVLEILTVDLYSYQNYRNCNDCVVFNPGSTLYVDVVIKNRGNHKAEDVYVKVSIPEVGISRNVYVGDIESCDGYDKFEDTERVTVPIILPNKEGSYTLEIEAYNTENRDKKTTTIFIEKQLSRNIQAIAQPEAEAKKGGIAKYSLTITNFGNTQEHVVVELLGINGFATATIAPASFDIGPGETRIVNIELKINENVESGIYPFTAQVKYGNEVKQFNLNANVKENTIDWKIVLMIVGIVLAAAIIVLLVITLVKQSKGSLEEKSEIESYY